MFVVRELSILRVTTGDGLSLERPNVLGVSHKLSRAFGRLSTLLEDPVALISRKQFLARRDENASIVLAHMIGENRKQTAVILGILELPTPEDDIL